ncbi:MAG: hypothetical protein J0H88_22240 [Sphingomonadales bacterium]|nr:hypothetical protein [Sphingomonadales bacterium]
MAIDWDEPMPPPNEVETGLGNSSVFHVTVDDALLAVTNLISRDWVNGRAMATQFQLDLDPRIMFFASRNRLHEIPFFPFLFSAPIWLDDEPLASFAELFGPPGPAPHGGEMERSFGFRLDSAWVSVAHLAASLEEGGAYSSPRLPDAEFGRLVAGVAEAAFHGRYRSTLAYHSYLPWCGWFFGDVRDRTWFWFDRQSGIATVFMITDAH